MPSRIINMTLPLALLKEADAAARTDGKTRSEVFREALRRYLAERREPVRTDSSELLSRLASLAVKGPKTSARDLDRVLYRKDLRR